MSSQVSRFDLLRRGAQPIRRPLRPPWALAETEFLSACTSCADCVERCPEKILRIDESQKPIVDFGAGGCTLCGECAEVCEVKALDPSTRSPFIHTISIGPNCISVSGTACRMCEEQCDEEAITFKPALGGRSIPFVSDESCTGCGACYSVCPADAINFQPKLMEAAI